MSDTITLIKLETVEVRRARGLTFKASELRRALPKLAEATDEQLWHHVRYLAEEHADGDYSECVLHDNNVFDAFDQSSDFADEVSDTSDVEYHEDCHFAQPVAADMKSYQDDAIHDLRCLLGCENESETWAQVEQAAQTVGLSMAKLREVYISSEGLAGLDSGELDPLNDTTDVWADYYKERFEQVTAATPWEEVLELNRKLQAHMKEVYV